ncbi:MAG: helix-turn-helix transcriptional regulator [Ruminococcus sp.]|nr:helix-turn-helix transcriptional regulator [Ruminococcus sp.]
MDKAELGKRLKEARLAKKLTQAEVVGTFITRNMLSQIESGTALPSVKTLQYLCEKLEIPISTFDTQEEPAPAEAGGYTAVREAFLKGDYQTVAEAECEGYSDELAALKARALLALANDANEQDADSLRQAADYAKRAARAAEQGIFANESLRSEAMLRFNYLALRLSEYYKSMVDSELAGIMG